MRKILIMLFVVSAVAAMGKLRPGEQRFVDAPMTVITHIDSLTRLDMLDYYHAGMEHASANVYDGECAVVDADSLMVTFRFTERFVGQVFVVDPEGRNPVTGYIETIATPVLDSNVTLYDGQWAELAGKLPDTGLDFWLTKEGKKHRAEVEEQLPFLMYTCEYMPENQALHYKLTIDKYYTADDQPQALRYLRPEVFCVWRGGKFKPLNP